MSCDSEVASALRARGIRHTSQRALILSTLKHAASQLTAAEVHARLPELQPATPVSLSTVYRTLEGLRDAGVVAAHQPETGGATFEWSASSTHHHLRCTRCGLTAEVELPRLVALESEIEARTGFLADIRHLAIAGLCADCARQPEVAP